MHAKMSHSKSQDNLYAFKRKIFQRRHIVVLGIDLVVISSFRNWCVRQSLVGSLKFQDGAELCDGTCKYIYIYFNPLLPKL